MIGNGLHPCVLGSRILGGYSLQGGMPWWKYVANRALTLVENLLLGVKLSEYHTGYRAFSREILERLDLSANSDDFVFDNQMLAQIFWHGFTIGEVSCPTKYFAEASSINFRRSVKYGFGCLATGLRFACANWDGSVTLVSAPPARFALPRGNAKGRDERARAVNRFAGGLLRAVDRQGDPGFLAIGVGAGDHAGLDRLVQRGQHIGQRLGGVGLFAGGERSPDSFLGATEAGEDGAVVQALALAAAHATFGGLGIRHSIVSKTIKAANTSETKSEVNAEPGRIWASQPYSRARESMRIVTGPSFTKSTCMSAPNSPVWTGRPRSCRSRATNCS